jgi:hypothetical protein
MPNSSKWSKWWPIFPIKIKLSCLIFLHNLYLIENIVYVLVSIYIGFSHVLTLFVVFGMVSIYSHVLTLSCIMKLDCSFWNNVFELGIFE